MQLAYSAAQANWADSRLSIFHFRVRSNLMSNTTSFFLKYLKPCNSLQLISFFYWDTCNHIPVRKLFVLRIVIWSDNCQQFIIFMFFLHFWDFHISVSLCFFPWGLRDWKSAQVSRTLLSILADLNNVVVWMLSTRFLISKSFSPIINSFWDCTEHTITIIISVTFIFPSLFFCVFFF